LSPSLTKKKLALPIIGRSDLADFPDLELYQIPVKTDTGAYTSSIHAVGIRTRRIGGEYYLLFSVAGMNHPGSPRKQYRFKDFVLRKVTSSNGLSEIRYVIRTHIRLMGKNIRTEFSLTNRSTMRSPVLLGRKLLKGRFLVDVSQKNLSLKK
jgi:hypothetical protein